MRPWAKLLASLCPDLPVCRMREGMRKVSNEFTQVQYSREGTSVWNATRHWCLPPSSDNVPSRGRSAHHCLQSWPMGRPRQEGGWEVINAGPGVTEETGRDGKRQRPCCLCPASLSPTLLQPLVSVHHQHASLQSPFKFVLQRCRVQCADPIKI